MREEFVTPDVAKLLQCNGFNLWCLWYWKEINEEESDYALERVEFPTEPTQYKRYPAPTIQTARDWLEYEHGYFIEIHRTISLTGKYRYGYTIQDRNCNCAHKEEEKYQAPFSAVISALEFCLKRFL